MPRITARTEIAKKRFEMAMDVKTLSIVDEWRRFQPDIPSRSEAVRRLVALAAVKTCSRCGGSGREP